MKIIHAEPQLSDYAERYENNPMHDDAAKVQLKADLKKLESSNIDSLEANACKQYLKDLLKEFFGE